MVVAARSGGWVLCAVVLRSKSTNDYQPSGSMGHHMSVALTFSYDWSCTIYL